MFVVGIPLEISFMCDGKGFLEIAVFGGGFYTDMSVAIK